jgi:hypothetical protein
MPQLVASLVRVPLQVPQRRANHQLATHFQYCYDRAMFRVRAGRRPPLCARA